MDRSRSRSPSRHTESPRKRKRSRSPRHHRAGQRSKPSTAPIPLPLGAHPLTRHDLSTHRSMFALYLDIQKQKYIEELPEDEVKGRWKSFIGKWNRGELAEGWYDPNTLEKAKSAEQETTTSTVRQTSPKHSSKTAQSGDPAEDGSDDDKEDYGPSPPTELMQDTSKNDKRAGPSMPRLDDLQIQRELLDEDTSTARRRELEGLRSARKAERVAQTALLDELAPKAAAGTRERQLQKKAEKAAANKAFADGPDIELPDVEVMGGGDSLDELKRMKQASERKKNEREIRREEVLRARQAEREERVRGMREKEEKTMAMLQEIARARFGGGNDEGATLRE